MPTASTRRGAKGARARKQTDAKPARARAADDAPPRDFPGAPPGDVPERAWRVGVIVVLAVAVVLRFALLELNPLHHDEGVNGWFLTRLLRQGEYAYDPKNYHGPTLYFITLVPAFLLERVLRAGMSVFMLRGVTSLFGVGIVWLVLCLRRYVGTVGALAAGALLAVSPGAVYQSRYFIHETPFVFFTLAVVVAALKFYETTRAKYLMLAFGSAALLFATKETAFISVGVLGLAWLVTRVWMRLAWRLRWERFAGGDVERGTDLPRLGDETRLAVSFKNNLWRFGGAKHFGLLLLGGLALFLAVNVLFYSSFFTNREGVRAAVETFQFWSKTGMEELAHAKPLTTYLEWLQQEEAPIYVLGLLGAAWALLGARHRFALFAGAWAFGLLAAYSLVKYKTPWLSLNFAVPMAVAAGYAVGEAYRWARGREVLQVVVLSLVVAGLAVSLYQTVVLNFYRYDDDKYPYVYSHTRREFLDMLAEIERVGEQTGMREKMPVALASTDYWPIPWYMRDHAGLAYSAAPPFNQPVVITSAAQEASLDSPGVALRAALAQSYDRAGEYPLRPGVELRLYVRRGLAGR